MKIIRVKQVSERRSGPKTWLGGERMNFVPGTSLRTSMDEVISDARKITGERLTYAYILREGGLAEVRYIKDLLKKTADGEAGAKKREGPWFPVEKAKARYKSRQSTK